MKAFILLCSLLLPLAAFAADLTCTVPQANIARGQQLCEDLRLQMRIATANWSNNKCASEFLRLGMIEVERRVTTRQANADRTADHRHGSRCVRVYLAAASRCTVWRWGS